ncbi:hypothetical protein Taro_017985 [Colocasia esculenta]|uniref:Homeobox domain-containing protein n=1 Tax=Colocasia esculenta TaxID=4460 RepID=A0A843UXR6_COLES|nr:hypothetical protein [Colocasia esculenta]
MDLGLSIGGSEARKRGEAPAPGGGEWPKEDAAHHPPLQLELKLSWPNHPVTAYQPRPCGPLAAVATAGEASLPAKAPAGDPDGCNDAGPSPSTSRSTAGGWKCSDEEGGGGGSSGGAAPRKKLRLTKEQSCYLEESFKEHATLNPANRLLLCFPLGSLQKQKLAIAKKLNLRPRQVEVWFQNRRARTKLKQTEVEYEYMKRCCESLTEENRRLHREIQELRALKAPAPHLRLHLPATTLSMCPSCERAAAAGRKAGGFGAPMKLREGYPKVAFPVS